MSDEDYVPLPIEVVRENMRKFREEEEARVAASRAQRKQKPKPKPKGKPTRKRAKPNAITRARLSHAARERHATAVLSHVDSSPMALARVRKGWTQRQAAAAAQIGTATWFEVEHGISNPSPRTRSRVARALDCKQSDLWR